MNRKRILLVTPAFHGYGESIAGALRRAGHSVALHEYDLNAGFPSKLRTKLLYELPGKLGSETSAGRQRANITSRAIEALTEADPDVVITVKGDVLAPDYWHAVDASGARQLLWLYDELARMHFGDEVLTSRPSIVSYSPHDVATLNQRGLRASHVLDAFDHTIPFTPIKSEDVVFVGARYPERTRILEGLHQRGVNVRAYGRDWSRHPVDRLRTWQVARPRVPSGRDVSRAEAYGLTAGAVGAVNSHTDQDGFTMRTYELPGTGSLQLIDRPDIDQLFEPDREVLVFRDLDELTEQCRRASREPEWGRAIAAAGQARTLAEHTFDHRIPQLESAWA